MKIKCPQCQKVFNAPDTYIGEKVKCLKCNHSFIVNPPIDKQQGKFRMRFFPFVLLGVVLLLLISVFLYWFPLGQFFKFSRKNIFVSDSNNVPLIKRDDLINSLDKQPISKPAIDDNNAHPTNEYEILPTLYSILDSKVYIADQVEWVIWSFSLEVVAKAVALGEKVEVKPDECLIEKDNVIEMINSSDNSFLFPYRKEISDLIKNSDFVFLKQYREEDKMPIRFASLKSKSVIIIGSICSDVTFNNVNTLLNTPKKRASAFIQKKVLPELLKGDIFFSICTTDFKYIGLIYIYGNKNFVKEEKYLVSPESLCIIIPLKDYSYFIKRELSQEEFLKKCFVFLKSEGANFVKVELVLD